MIHHSWFRSPVQLLSVCLLVTSSADAFGIRRMVRTGRTRASMPLRMFNDEDPGSTTTEEKARVFPVQKTDEEWKELLTPDQYYILFKEGTETPGASPLNNISIEKNGPNDAGTFLCAACDVPLFLSEHKYDSGTGWPSFSQPVTNSAVGLQTDYKMVVPRTECICNECGGHLGHVFEDGPEPTGQRYCMNGAAMVFYRDSERPELQETAAQMAAEDPFRLAPSQLIPSVIINVIIGGLFFNAFVQSGKSTPIEFLTLVPATYYGFLAAKALAKLNFD